MPHRHIKRQQRFRELELFIKECRAKGIHLPESFFTAWDEAMRSMASKDRKGGKHQTNHQSPS
jgi:hypothetical protein